MADLYLPKLGNALSQGAQARYYGERADAAADENARSNEARPLLQRGLGGDRAAFDQGALLDPKTAAILDGMIQRRDVANLARIKGAADFTARAAGAVLSAGPAERAAVYRQFYEEGTRLGHDLTGMPPEYSPGVDANLKFQLDKALPVSARLSQMDKAARRGAGGGGGAAPPSMVEPLTPRPAAPAAAPGPRPPGPAASSAFAPMPPMQMAEALPPAQEPVIPQGGGDESGSPGDAYKGRKVPTKPPPETTIWDIDPELHGGQMRWLAATTKSPRRPYADDRGFIVYTMPYGRDVLYRPSVEKPKQERPQPPQGYSWGPMGSDGRETQIPIQGGPYDPSVLARNAEARRTADAKAIPGSVTKGIQENVAALRQIDRALKALGDTPDSVGGPGSVAAAVIPGAGWLQNRIDKDGTKLRALIADIGSLVIHQRSGAAVTAAEFPRLRPFIPSIADDPDTVKTKLANFRAVYEDEIRDTTEYYGPANGFREYSPATTQLNGGQATPKVGNAEQGKLLFEARDAISKGAPREAVIKRLRELGVEGEP